jgi:coenzyme PQQ biosynthesis protein PqqD
MISRSSVYRHRGDVRFRVIDDEAVLVRQDAGEMIVLNETGARILELIDGERSVESIIDEMSQEFESSREELQRDVTEFVQQLIDLGVAEEATPLEPDAA